MAKANFLDLVCPNDQCPDFELLYFLDGEIRASCNHCNNEFVLGELQKREELNEKDKLIKKKNTGKLMPIKRLNELIERDILEISYIGFVPIGTYFEMKEKEYVVITTHFNPLKYAPMIEYEELSEDERKERKKIH
jgi:hypothetical protein